MNIRAFGDVLKQRNYALYAAGNTVSLIGTWIQIIAFGWVTWEMTRSPLWLGVVSAAGIIPTLLGGVWGGILADKVDRLRLTLWTQALSLVLTVIMFVLYQTGTLTLLLMVIIKASLSAITALSQPARMALISRLVRPDQLGTAISFSSLTFNLARFIGPALAGVIIAAAGVGITFLANAATFAFMGLMVAMMRLPKGITKPVPLAKSEDKGTRPTGAIAYVMWTSGPLILFTLLTIVVISVRPVSEFFPAIASEQFGLGIEAVATLTSCLAAGSIVGGLWTAGRPISGQSRSVLTSSLLYALSILAFLHTSSLLVGAIVLIIAGMFTAIFAISAQTLIQTGTPDALRGRVLGFWFVLNRAGPDLGALVIGLSTSLIGLHYSLIAGATLCMIVTLSAWIWHSQIKADLEVEATATATAAPK
ncbi:MFS transporter [Brevundimonas vesicularis]|uniref:MFS transporter n=1 Tax=Brevundimonas vesicularis TaxID=41276 RepID=UPI0038D47720